MRKHVLASDRPLIVAGPTLLAFALAPFVLAQALTRTPSWRDLRVPTLAFGVGTIVLAIAGSGVGEGLGQYLAVIAWFAWIAVLAVRMLCFEKGVTEIARSS